MIVLWTLTALAASPTKDLPTVEVVEIEPACGVGGSTWAEPPTAPRKEVSLPTSACTVDDAKELHNAVLGVGCALDDIILNPGTYHASDLRWGTFLSLTRPVRLWARSPRNTVLDFGISMKDHPGSELHGLNIDLSDTPGNAVPIGSAGISTAITWWTGPSGSGGDIVVEDVILRGGGKVRYGIRGDNAEGITLGRIGVEGFTRFGIRVGQSTPVSTDSHFHDLVIRDVGDPDWRTKTPCVGDGSDAPGCYAAGTEEHGLWIGGSALVERVQVRDVWWAGVITGNCGSGGCGAPLTDVHMQEIDVDRIGVGSGSKGAGAAIAFERVTRESDVLHFCAGPDTERGVQAEWNHSHASESAKDLVITKGWIRSSPVGVFLGSGTEDTTLEDLEIPDASWTGVAMECCGHADPDTCTTTSIGTSVKTASGTPQSCALGPTGWETECGCP